MTRSERWSQGRARENRARWNATSDTYQATHDPHIGRAPKLWGMFAVPEVQINALGPVAGLDVLELGCGAAQWAASLAEEGARVTGLDLSEMQLRAARRRRPSLPLVQANAEVLPFADRSFDVVFCDHGAMSWGEPFLTVPEAARVLRPGGRLIFNATSPWMTACYDEERDLVGSELRMDYFGMHVIEEGGGAATYTLAYGGWIRLFRRNRLTVEDLIEIQPPAGATTTYARSDPADWFQRWPGETLWVTRKEAT